MVQATRKHDPDRPVTIGLLPLMGPKDLEALAGELDYLSVHIYPNAGKVDDAVKLARAFAVGRPLVVEETFPLSCGVKELREFIEQTRGVASGWIGFYWGPSLDVLKQSKEPVDRLQVAWLELFQRMAPAARP